MKYPIYELNSSIAKLARSQYCNFLGYTVGTIGAADNQLTGSSSSMFPRLQTATPDKSTKLKKTTPNGHKAFHVLRSVENSTVRRY